MNHLRINGYYSKNGNGKDDSRNICYNDSIVTYDTASRNRTLYAKTDGQHKYIDAIEKYDVVFCLGPAGTGKTHVASGMASKLYLSGAVSKIKLVRPAVEMGRSLGFLPGNLDEKIHPYMQPILDELQEFLGVSEMKKLRHGKCPILEFGVLQYMRGCNFKDSFVILDEAQNATFAELWMFLTRFSYGSKLIINGDPSQSDLVPSARGALEHFAGLYEDFDEVEVVRMKEADSVRHPLVTKMLIRDAEVK